MRTLRENTRTRERKSTVESAGRVCESLTCSSAHAKHRAPTNPHLFGGRHPSRDHKQICGAVAHVNVEQAGNVEFTVYIIGFYD